MLICSVILEKHVAVTYPFILRGSTARSSRTGDYLAVSERFGQNTEPAGRNEERTRKKLSLVSKVDLADALSLQTSNHDFTITLCVSFYYY